MTITRDKNNLSSMMDNTETYELWEIHQSQDFINYDQNEYPRTRRSVDRDMA